MYLNTMGKNEMYMSVAEILGTDIKVIKNFVIENSDEIVDCHYDEYGIEQMDLGNFINGNGIKRIDRYLFHNYFFSLCLLWHRLFIKKISNSIICCTMLVVYVIWLYN